MRCTSSEMTAAGLTFGPCVFRYIDVDMNTARIMFPYYRSLQSFWPGLQVLYGDLEEARTLFDRFFSIWRK